VSIIRLALMLIRTVFRGSPLHELNVNYRTYVRLDTICISNLFEEITEEPSQTPTTPKFLVPLKATQVRIRTHIDHDKCVVKRW